MNPIRQAASMVFHRIVAFVADLLPREPSDEPEPPDIDGRRRTEADTTRITVDREGKEGKGGFR